MDRAEIELVREQSLRKRKWKRNGHTGKGNEKGMDTTEREMKKGLALAKKGNEKGIGLSKKGK